MIDAIWLLCQFLTAVAYFHIPYEIYRWTKGVDLHGLQRIAWLFVGFIVFCGAHHGMMVYTMQHHIQPVQLLSDVPMAALSLATSYILIKFRTQITGIVSELAAKI